MNYSFFDTQDFKSLIYIDMSNDQCNNLDRRRMVTLPSTLIDGSPTSERRSPANNANNYERKFTQWDCNENSQMNEDNRFLQLLANNIKKSSVRINGLKIQQLEASPNKNTLSNILLNGKVVKSNQLSIQKFSEIHSVARAQGDSRSITGLDSQEKTLSMNQSSGNLVKASSLDQNTQFPSNMPDPWMPSSKDPAQINLKNTRKLDSSLLEDRLNGLNSTMNLHSNYGRSNNLRIINPVSKRNDKCKSIKTVFVQNFDYSPEHQNILKRIENKDLRVPRHKNAPIFTENSDLTSKLIGAHKHEENSLTSFTERVSFGGKKACRAPDYTSRGSNFCDFYLSTKVSVPKETTYNSRSPINRSNFRKKENTVKNIEILKDIVLRSKSKLEPKNMPSFNQKNSIVSIRKMDFHQLQKKDQLPFSPKKNMSSIQELGFVRGSSISSKFKGSRIDTPWRNSKNIKFNFGGVASDKRLSKLGTVDLLKKNLWLELIKRTIALPQLKFSSKIRYYEILGIKENEPQVEDSNEYDWIKNISYKLRKDLEGEIKYDFRFRPLALKKFDELEHCWEDDNEG
jgi:hypothetical protein